MTFLVAENAHEVFSVDKSLTINLIGLKHHLLKFILTHVLTKLLSSSFKVLKIDVVFVLTEEDKSLVQLLFAVSLAHFGGHDVEEVIEINSDFSVLRLLLFTVFV